MKILLSAIKVELEPRQHVPVTGLRLFHCTRAEKFDYFKLGTDNANTTNHVLGPGVYLTGSRGMVRMYKRYLPGSRIVETSLHESARIYPLTLSEYTQYRQLARTAGGHSPHAAALNKALKTGGYHGVAFFSEPGILMEMAVFDVSLLSRTMTAAVLDDVPLHQGNFYVEDNPMVSESAFHMLPSEMDPAETVAQGVVTLKRTWPDFDDASSEDLQEHEQASTRHVGALKIDGVNCRVLTASKATLMKMQESLRRSRDWTFDSRDLDRTTSGYINAFGVRIRYSLAHSLVVVENMHLLPNHRTYLDGHKQR